MIHHESIQQRALISWVRAMAKTDNRYKWFFAIPNGGKRSKVAAVNLVREGVQAGVFDLFLPLPNKKMDKIGLWIEMKWGNNKLTDKQEEFCVDMVARSYYCDVCYSWTEAKLTIENYINLC